ncbi:hypothetical protein [Eubacterium sp.]|uniref:hypothetical protein n=1 Tax=Eubacterium sp. TaxID=142586 RepID=UPI003F0C61EE
MRKFETPEIEVVMFMNTEVISTSSGEGYEGSVDEGGIGFSSAGSASQPTMEIPF